jgi:hypothetical protein
LYIRAVVTEYGQPLETHPEVVATMTRPDQTTAELSFFETDLGQFESSVVATQAGGYRFHLRAAGLSSRLQPFTREHLLTAVVGYPPRDPVIPPTDGGHAAFCEFLKCLAGKGVLTERFIKQLEGLGINVVQLGRCLEECCRLKTRR